MLMTRNANPPEILTLLELLDKTDQGKNWSEVTASIIEKTLSACWTQLEGSNQEGTTPEKLLGRTEKMIWSPPLLTFMIERHGRTVSGSTRADLHTWQVNFKNMTARIVRRSFRQLEPTQSRLDIKPLVEKIIQAVASDSNADGITWVQERKMVKVVVSHFVPDNCCEQTLATRRKRFRICLDERMENLGWNRKPGRFYVYLRT